MLDHLIIELDNRFSKNSMLIITEFMNILPSQLKPSVGLELNNLLHLYEDDLPSPRNLDTELDIWKTKWLGDLDQAKDLNTPEKCNR